MEFDALKDLVKTITRNKVKQIEVLGNPGEEGSLVEAFYDAVVKEKVQSDEEAVAFLYGKNESPKSQAYLRLKGRLERSLINTAFFVDVNQPMFNERTKAYYNCYRDFAASYILLGRGATKAGIDVLEHLLEQTIKYEFVELTSEVASRLRREYSRVGSVAQHERFAKIHREYEEKRRLEMLALEHFETLINYYIVRRSPNEEIHLLATRFYDELQPLAAQADTCQFYYHTAQIGIIKYLSINNCASAREICIESLALLKSRPNTNRSVLVATSNQQIACLTQLRIFDNNEADEAAAYCLSLTEEGSFNWFRSLELYLHFCLFAGRYEDALGLFEKASKHPKFESLGGAVRDNWQLYGGYLHLLVVLGKLEAKKVEKIVGTFRYAKLTNEIEVLGKDKQGMNIPLIFLPVLYNLAKGTFDTADISTESLEKYRKRYLDNDMNRRSAAFLNMLIAFAKKDFQSASAEKKIAKEKEILSKAKPQVAGQTFAVEIIPYEDLWQMMAG